MESLLFGYDKGAFTGADKSRPGLIKQADRGTLFLDEVGELPPSLQKAFLRVLQEHRFRPLGSEKEEKSNFRLVVATNRDLDEMVEAGKFRDDLLYRLRSFVIKLPPLRKRPADIKDLAMYYMAKVCEKTRIMTKGFSPDFFEVLGAYHWPGNVRELFQTIDSVLTVAHDEPIIFPTHLPVHIRAEAARASLDKKKRPPASADNIVEKDLLSIEQVLPFKDYRKKLLDNGEKRYFNYIASLAKGNIAQACRISGLSRSRLYHFLQKYDISLSSGARLESSES